MKKLAKVLDLIAPGRMRGWKTWTGAALLMLAGVLGELEAARWDMLGDSVRAVGLAFLGVGLGHKFEKASSMLLEAFVQLKELLIIEEEGAD